MKLNCYTYDELNIGDTESFTVIITDEMMSDFHNMTGNSNPLHTDENFEQKSLVGGKNVYGMITASFMSTLAGMYLPGKYSFCHKVEAEFPNPVYVGDTLTFTGEVISKNDDFRLIDLKVTALNNSEKKVLRGKMQVGLLK